MTECEKHDRTMSRIFTEIENIKRTQEVTNSKFDEIIDFKNMIHKVMYGNGKDGLITKVSKCFQMQSLQWFFIGSMGFILAGVGAWALQALINKAMGV